MPKLIGLLLVLALLCVAYPQRIVASQPGKSTESEVIAVVQQLADAQRTFDQAALERVLAPDYIEVSPAGDVDSRDKVIGFYGPDAKAKAPPVDAIKIDETTVRIYGDYATVIARQTMSMNVGGTSRSVVMRVTAHVRKISGAWRVSSMHYTGVRPPKAQIA